MSRHFRLQLGHHSAGDGSLNAYSRDLLAAPLREYTAMLGSIRHGAFNPDLTRSGRFSAVVKLEVHESEAEGADTEEPGRQLDDVVAEAVSEPPLPAAQDPVDSDSSVESSSSDSMDSDEESLPRQGWKPGMDMYRHKRTKTLHFAPPDKEERSCFRVAAK